MGEITLNCYKRVRKAITVVETLIIDPLQLIINASAYTPLSIFIGPSYYLVIAKTLTNDVLHSFTAPLEIFSSLVMLNLASFSLTNSINHLNYWYLFSNTSVLATEREEFNAPYSTNEQSLNSTLFLTSDIMQETTQNQRFTLPHNAIFKYDFRVGNYMPDGIKKMNLHMFSTLKDITAGIRTSS